jgi:hypothetical protein
MASLAGKVEFRKAWPHDCSLNQLYRVPGISLLTRLPPGVVQDRNRLRTRVALAPTRRNQNGPLNQEGQSQLFNEALVFQFFPPEGWYGRHP